MKPSTLVEPKAQPVLGTGTYFGVCHQRGKTIQRSRHYTTTKDNMERTRVGRCHCGLHVFLEHR